MANFEVPKDAIEGKPAIPSGVYKLRIDGFKPALSSKRDSYNLNPQLRVVEPEEYRDTQVFFNMNSNFGPGVNDLVHSAGFDMTQNPATGGYIIPGKFDGPDEDASQWKYSGPLLGAVVTVELIEVPSQIKDPANPGKYKADPSGKTRNVIKRFLGAADDPWKYSDNIAGKD